MKYKVLSSWLPLDSHISDSVYNTLNSDLYMCFLLPRQHSSTSWLHPTPLLYSHSPIINSIQGWWHLGNFAKNFSPRSRINSTLSTSYLGILTCERLFFQDWAFCSLAYLASGFHVLLSYSESWGNLRRANFGGFGGLKFGKVQCLCLAHQQQMCSWIIKGHWTAVQCSTDVLMSLNKYVAPGETGQTTNK